jgi:hypothetical protein
MPDVLVDFNGLRVALEGKLDTGPQAQRDACADAFERVEAGVAHVGMAVLYPQDLASLPLAQLEEQMPSTSLQVAVFTEASEDDSGNWESGDVDHIAELLRRTYEKLTEQNAVNRAAEIIRQGTEEFSIAFLESPGALDRAMQTLGIQIGDTSQGDTDEEEQS